MAQNRKEISPPSPLNNSSTSSCLTQLCQAVSNQRSSTKSMLDELDERLSYQTNTKRSIKSRLYSEFHIVETTETPEKSFHTTDVATRKGKTYYLKYNYPINSVMSELEAANHGFFRLFVPDLVPESSHPFHDDKRNVLGIASQQMDIENLIKKPLQIDDLKIEALEQKRLTISEFETILQECYTHYKKLDDIPDNEQLFFKLDNRQIALKASDIKHFEIVSNNGLMWMFNFLLEDDDPHRANVSKKGKRFDFDMTVWPVSSLYKNCNIVDKQQRLPTKDTFTITAEIIENFPVIVKNGSYHWPTKPHAKITTTVIEALKPVVSFSQNAFTEEDKRKYSLFASHEVFMHYKFVAITMFCLSNANIYYHIADLYINRQVTIDGTEDGKSLVRHLAEHLGKRVDACRCTVATMSSFREFFQHHGARVKNRLLAQFEKHNAVINEKIKKKLQKDADFLLKYPEYEQQLIDLNAIHQSFKDLEELCDQERTTKQKANILFNLHQKCS